MVWTAPMTAADGNVFTAAEFNLNLRDNLNYLKTEMDGNPRALATAANQYFVATAANTLAARSAGYAENLNTFTSTSSSYSDIPSSSGPAVTVTTGTRAIVIWGAMMNTNSDETPAGVSYAVSGATTIAAGNDRRVWFDGLPANNAFTGSSMYMHTTLTPGSNTFTLKFISTATGTDWEERRILVIPF